jgi:hypothetical protein
MKIFSPATTLPATTRLVGLRCLPGSVDSVLTAHHKCRRRAEHEKQTLQLETPPKNFPVTDFEEEPYTPQNADQITVR